MAARGPPSNAAHPGPPATPPRSQQIPVGASAAGARPSKRGSAGRAGAARTSGGFVHLLPAELALAIFAKLAERDLVSCLRVSRPWRAVVLDPTLWVSVSLSLRWPAFIGKALPALLPRCQGILESLQFKIVSSDTAWPSTRDRSAFWELFEAATAGRRLRRLVVDGPYHGLFAPKFRETEWSHIWPPTSHVGKVLAEQVGPALEELVINRCFEDLANVLRPLLLASHRLVKLEVVGCPNVSGACVPPCEEDEAEASDAGAAAAKEHLVPTADASHDSISAFSSSPPESFLSVSSPGAAAEKPPPRQDRPFSHLRELKVIINQMRSTSFVTNIVTHRPPLRTLCFRNNLCSDEHLARIVRLVSPTLTELDLTYSQADVLTLTEISRCSALEILIINGCNYLSDDSLLLLGKPPTPLATPETVTLEDHITELADLIVPSSPLLSSSPASDLFAWIHAASASFRAAPFKTSDSLHRQQETLACPQLRILRTNSMSVECLETLDVMRTDLHPGAIRLAPPRTQ
jgi:hypothetical protein